MHNTRMEEEHLSSGTITETEKRRCSKRLVNETQKQLVGDESEPTYPHGREEKETKCMGKIL